MLSIKEKKLEMLYQFYAANGDKLTMEAIAEGIGITPKTIFNRYHTREEMEQVLQNHWRGQVLLQLDKKLEFCNNSVEKLLFFINELLASQNSTACFFEREMAMRADFTNTPDPVFANFVQKIIDSDSDHEIFSDSFNPEIYSHYFIYFIFNILSKNKDAQYVDFLLKPVLTQVGADILADIDVARLLD